MLAVGLVNRHRTRDIMKERLEDAGRHVVHELERFLNTLGTIASISPLLGLLGTVTGIIRAFNAISLEGAWRPRVLSAGIGEALIATAAGPCVAIPLAVCLPYSARQGEPHRHPDGKRSDEARRCNGGRGCPQHERAHHPRYRHLMNLNRDSESQGINEPEINVVSLIDVVLLLVVFFMVSSTFVEEGRIKVQLPNASSVPVNSTIADPIVVTVTAQGAYRVNERSLINNSPETLLSRTAAHDRRAPQDSVTIRADARATHQSVDTLPWIVIGRLGFAQINIRDF